MQPHQTQRRSVSCPVAVVTRGLMAALCPLHGLRAVETSLVAVAAAAGPLQAPRVVVGAPEEELPTVGPRGLRDTAAPSTGVRELMVEPTLAAGVVAEVVALEPQAQAGLAVGAAPGTSSSGRRRVVTPDPLSKVLPDKVRHGRHVLCRRCSDPGPPPHRWPGDLWARDHRGPHTRHDPWRNVLSEHAGWWWSRHDRCNGCDHAAIVGLGNTRWADSADLRCAVLGG